MGDRLVGCLTGAFVTRQYQIANLQTLDRLRTIGSLDRSTGRETALALQCLRDALWGNVAFTQGSIIYDFGDRRLNEIYPDKKLAPTDAQMRAVDIGVVASDLMWDAVLASVPEQPVAPKANPKLKLKTADLESYIGEYVFSEFAKVTITTHDDKLFAQATGARNAFAIKRDTPAELQPVSGTEFTLPGRYPFVMKFAAPGQMVLNPGRWEQTGERHAP